MANVIRITNSAGFVTAIETDADFVEINGVKISIPTLEVFNEKSIVRVFSFEPEQIYPIPFIKALREATGYSLVEGKRELEQLRGQLYNATDRFLGVSSTEFQCHNAQAATEFAAELKKYGIKTEFV